MDTLIIAVSFRSRFINISDARSRGGVVSRCYQATEWACPWSHHTRRRQLLPLIDAGTECIIEGSYGNV